MTLHRQLRELQVLLVLVFALLLALLGAARTAHAQDHGHDRLPPDLVPPAVSGSPHPSGPAPHDPRAHDAKGHGEHAGGEHALEPFNLADFSNTKTRPFAALLINFAILLFLYYRFGKTGIATALKNRRQSIAKEIEDAQRIKKEASLRAKEYQAKLEKLDEEMEVARKGLVEAGKGEKDRIVHEAQEKAERLQRDAQFLLEQELKQMKVDLTRETVEIAVAAAEQLLRQRVTQADHDRMAEDFLAQLQAQTKSAISRPPVPGSAPPAPPAPPAGGAS
jgi:F-type H+-transporting ATPase subunit b